MYARTFPPHPPKFRLLALCVAFASIACSAAAETGNLPQTESITQLSISKFVADPDHPRLYAIHKNGAGQGTLLVYDTITREILHNIPVGNDPTDCDVSEDGSKVWVLNAKDPSLMAVSTTTW